MIRGGVDAGPPGAFTTPGRRAVGGRGGFRRPLGRKVAIDPRFMEFRTPREVLLLDVPGGPRPGAGSSSSAATGGARSSGIPSWPARPPTGSSGDARDLCRRGETAPPSSLLSASIPRLGPPRTGPRSAKCLGLPGRSGRDWPPSSLTTRRSSPLKVILTCTSSPETADTPDALRAGCVYPRANDGDGRPLGSEVLVTRRFTRRGSSPPSRPLAPRPPSARRDAGVIWSTTGWARSRPVLPAPPPISREHLCFHRRTTFTIVTGRVSWKARGRGRSRGSVPSPATTATRLFDTLPAPAPTLSVRRPITS